MYTYAIFVKGHENMIPFPSNLPPEDILPSLRAQMKNGEIITIEDFVEKRKWLVRGEEIQVVLYQGVEE